MNLEIYAKGTAHVGVDTYNPHVIDTFNVKATKGPSIMIRVLAMHKKNNSHKTLSTNILLLKGDFLICALCRLEKNDNYGLPHGILEYNSFSYPIRILDIYMKFNIAYINKKMFCFTENTNK